MVLEDSPGDLLVRDALDDLEPREVDVPDAIGELVADLLVTASDVLAPPSANVVDRLEGFFGALVDRELPGVALLSHGAISPVSLGRGGASGLSRPDGLGP